jgi:hypothetical protein
MGWMNEFRTIEVVGLETKHGSVYIPVAWTRHPEASYADRSQDAPHVKIVEKSITEHGMMETTVVVVIWLEDLVLAGIDVAKKIDLRPLQNGGPPVPMYVIAGLHTSTAVKNLHNRHPRNHTFTHLLVVLIICARTPENIALAKLYGGLDNKIKDTKLSKQVWEYVQEMHRWYTSPDFKQLAKEVTKKWQEDFNLKTSAPLASINSWKVVAKVTGELWENINKIMTGKTESKKPPPKNTTFWNGMSGIPMPNLIRWSQRVVDGESLPREFAARCQQFKKSLMAQVKFLEFANLILESEDDDIVDTYNELVSLYPFFGEKLWFNRCVGWMSDKSKDDLNSSIKSSIVEQKKKHDTKKANEPVNTCLTVCENKYIPQGKQWRHTTLTHFYICSVKKII